MLNDASLGSLLAVHRRYSVAGAIVWIVVIATGLGTLLSARQDPAHLGVWLTAWGLALAALLAIAISAYRVIRQQLIADVERREAILSLANRDELTGVLNRAYFLGQLKQHVRLESAHAVGYMQIDMDNLKVLNDGSGHAAGDA